MNFKSNKVITNRFTQVSLLIAGLLVAIGLWSCDSDNEEGNISYYKQVNLVADQASQGAAYLDTNLVNPWGIAYGPQTYFWIADNHSGKSTVYDGTGTAIALVVTIPPPADSPQGTIAAPTGIVYNNSSDFMGDKFIFDTEDGTISGWQTGADATLRATVPDAVYKGLAIGTNTLGDLLIYATNFAAGTVDIFDDSYEEISIGPNAFKDPTLPAGFNPFGIQNIGNKIYVAFAERIGQDTDETAGPGLGYVSVFNTDGTFEKRLVSGGVLNAPWGLAKAPADFGPFSGALLVGNFGDGRISAFDIDTGSFLGQLGESKGNPITIDGLWGLSFGNDLDAGKANILYFTAGIDDENHGLFGSLEFVP